MRIKMMRSKRILLALVLFTSLFGCGSKESRTVPSDLAGVWKTATPKYRDCYLQLAEDSISFANEALLERNDNSISKIEKTHKGKQILYTIHYEDKEGQEYKFSFFYDPSKGGAIRFKNQPQIKWRKVDMPLSE
jgi:uncharacterized lipoprotein YehR (DUF1307 family)